MPYIVKKLPNGKWGKFKKENGRYKLVSHHDTKQKANASIKAYYANRNENKVGVIKKSKYGYIGETSMSEIKLKDLLSEKWNTNPKEEKQEQQIPKYSTKEKKEFMEQVAKFNEYGNKIYRNYDLAEITQTIKNISEMASNILLDEVSNEDTWFDSITINKNVKSLRESIKIFEKTAKELLTLQHRFENAYEDIGNNLSKYYKID